MITEKRWIVASPITSEIINKYPAINPVILQLLWNREIRTQEDIDLFLGSNWDTHIHSPFLFTQMNEAVERTFEALKNNEAIVVHGDYDADGVCGSTVLIKMLRDMCRGFGYDESRLYSYIPDREKEGYGVSIDTIKKIKVDWDTSLLITVDCGISNKDAIDYGKTIGIDTIVCDHHTIPDELPDAILIHPLVEGETYPNKKLCGTGVAFKFACAMYEHAREIGGDIKIGEEKWLLDLVAIATVTDVMQLVGENRVLEKYGLMVLNKTKRIGLIKLVEVAGGKMGELDTMSVGFMIGPRINAAGRMQNASKALDLLLEEDEDKAGIMARELDKINKDRQKVSREICKQAIDMVESKEKKSLSIVVGDGWPAGLIGLVAGKLVTEYQRPAYVVTKKGDKYVGSGRTIKGFDVTAALRVASDYLDKFGGHPEACGFTTTGDERFDKLCESLFKSADSIITDEMINPSIDIDAILDLSDVSWDLIADLEVCRPFGCGNTRPLFASENVRIVNMDCVGSEDQHLRLTVQSGNGKMIKMIGFRFGEYLQKLSIGKEFGFVYEIDVNEWRGRREIQLRIVDIKT